MKYFIVPEIDYGYEELEGVTGHVYSAESKEELFQFIHGKPIDYEITEDDVMTVDRSQYKSERSYKDALVSRKKNMSSLLETQKKRWYAVVYEFTHNCIELNIPCTETTMKLVQTFTIGYFV